MLCCCPFTTGHWDQLPWDLCSRSGACSSYLAIDITKGQKVKYLYRLHTSLSAAMCSCRKLERRSLLTYEQSSITYQQEILQPLGPVRLSKQAAVTHCISKVSLENQKADRGARKAALQPLKTLALFLVPEEPCSRDTITSCKSPTWATVARILTGLRRKLFLITPKTPLQKARLQCLSRNRGW